MEQAPAPTPHRRPPALLPPSIARLGGFAALALLGALQWQRMVSDLSSGSAVLWVLVAVLAAVGIMWADRAPRWRATATLGTAFLALLAAYAASGLSLNYLKPRQWDDLAVGLSNGAEALANVQMPYQGADPWPSATLQLLGALLCVLAGLLAFWPRAERTSTNGTGMQGRGYPFFALALLLVLVAAPVVSLGGTAPLEFGIALTAMTVCFLWLERLPIAPGARDRGAARCSRCSARCRWRAPPNREEPWFDYKAFAEALGPDEPIAFNWGHSYGPITWPRDGSEVLRVASRRPSYWKVATLDDFDGDTWVDSRPDSARAAADVEDDLAFDWGGPRRLARDAARDAPPAGHAGDRRRGHDARRRGHQPDGRRRPASRASGARRAPSARATRTRCAPTCRGPRPRSSPSRAPGSTTAAPSS